MIPPMLCITKSAALDSSWLTSSILSVSIFKSIKGTYNYEIPKTNNKFYDAINPIEQKTLEGKIVNNYPGYGIEYHWMMARPDYSDFNNNLKSNT